MRKYPKFLMISTQKCYRNRVSAFFGILLLISTPIFAYSADSLTGVVLEDFSTYRVGQVPSEGWRSRGGDAEGSYRIASEDSGNLFLQAQDQGKSVQYFREKGWKIKEYPILTWRWRAHELPKGGDERYGKSNDSAAAVYVVFPRRWFIPEAIKYVWSSNAPKGTDIKRSSRFPMVVLRSGPEKKSGEWVLEERNVYEDFQRLFGRRPSNPVAIGFLTDANETKSSAKADYDDFRVIPGKSNPVQPNQ